MVEKIGVFLGFLCISCTGEAFTLGSSTDAEVTFEERRSSDSGPIQEVAPEAGVLTPEASDDVTPLPASCAGLVDGDHRLVLSGGEVTVWCHAGREYLTVSPDTNFSTYASGGVATGSMKTTFFKVRFLPSLLAIDATDHFFAMTAGSVGPADTVTDLPYGVAASCDASTSGVASIDLTGTPFSVAPGAFEPGGFNPGGDAKYGKQTVTLSGGGYCGWEGPKGLEKLSSPIVRLSIMW